jgi:hypothetical protein
MSRKIMLSCGILSSLLYATLLMVVPLYWADYNSATQTVSELSAIGAPTRIMWISLCTPYTLLVIAFAAGIWKSAGPNRPLRFTASLIIIYGALGLLWPFAPMHLRPVLATGGTTFSDTLHIALGAVNQILFLLAMGFASVAFGSAFRLYCITTFIALAVFGTLTFLNARLVAKNQPTPLIGLWERINIGVFLLWVIVLASILLQAKSRRKIHFYSL